MTKNNIPDRSCEICGGTYTPVSSRQKWCKTCIPDRVFRARHRRYGLSKPQLDEMMEAQDGKCAICREPIDWGPNTCVDHCHSTGRARGITCRICNMVLNKFDADEGYADRVYKYLDALEGRR